MPSHTLAQLRNSETWYVLWGLLHGIPTARGCAPTAHRSAAMLSAHLLTLCLLSNSVFFSGQFSLLGSNQAESSHFMKKTGTCFGQVFNNHSGS